ncbi:CPBP family intramembrane glutamic endopeptidase [Streptomyces boninensis]|uniref:CPBP family intramembrane glutamic endopeptidase n=1 Tax=Streptomyces boninensis TaxID=2039455 RepID=UPI003B2169C9
MADVRAVAGAGCVLAAAGVVRDRVRGVAGVPVSLAATGALIVIARRAGCTPGELGLGTVGKGLRYGAAAAGVVGAGYAAGALLPATRPLFDDDRAAGTGAGLARQALVEVPFGTVLLEEAGFRAVLPALLRPACGEVGADVVAAGLFGLWHILPSRDLVEANPALAGAASGGAAPSPARAAVSAVVTTAAAGVVFAALRRRSGSVIAPALLHAATNSLGYAAAWAVRRRARPASRA